MIFYNSLKRQGRIYNFKTITVNQKGIRHKKIKINFKQKRKIFKEKK